MTATGSQVCYDDFRQELLAAGLLVATGVDGLYGRSGTFESIVGAIDAMVHDAAADQDAPTVHYPPLMPRAVFERTEYYRSFPDLMGSVHSFDGDDRAHARLIERAMAGDDWSDLLQPTELMLCSAACHPLYPSCSGRLAPGGRRVEVIGHCFRHEPSIDPARMQSFRQHEVVYLGDEAGARAHRDDWLERALSLLRRLGLHVEPVVANDPFFGRAGRLLANDQRENALKFEVVAPICSAGAPTAIASSNCHLDHFGRPFDIETADGEVAHSACVGFGVERITLALLRSHGLDPGGWPTSVRDALWP